MADLADALNNMTAEPGGLVIEAPPSWSQGRTLYGGMTAALCYEAAKTQFAGQAPLRSAQLLFVGPASGRLSCRAETLRAGKSATIVAVDCVAETGPAARAAFVFGSGRDSRVTQSMVAPETLASPENCPPFVERTGGFHDNFETRIADGSPLFSGGAPTFTVWVRFRDRQHVDPMTALLALADALPPAAMARFPEPAPISTMSWSIDFANQPASVDGWHLLRSTSDLSQDGYSMQQMHLWDTTGAGLAIGRQSVVIFI